MSKSVGRCHSPSKNTAGMGTDTMRALLSLPSKWEFGDDGHCRSLFSNALVHPCSLALAFVRGAEEVVERRGSCEAVFVKDW